MDRAFAGNAPPQDNEEDLLLNETARLANAPALGRVTLVGAGPGDAELLTLKAVRALQAADVILFDDLVSLTFSNLPAVKPSACWLANVVGGKAANRTISTR